MDSVEKAIYDNSTRLSITLEGLPGNTPREKFHNAAVKGLWAKLYPDKNGWETPASPGFGTAWEMYTVFEAALENKRVWGEIEWFDGDGKGNRWKVPNRDMGPAPDDSWEDQIYKDYRDIKDGIKEVDWIF
ncbi:polymorphic toxin type 27 domain-containing protein [Embleya hyalina]|uniref:Bacterial toxin 27 domain-containing protein n=1 Tax=Embleya hyalina TaxID=516124 RepID=A0A401YX77_9ACTN|nr:polymorphic toxin type 27 domain-containing protein [Embleya hyalina]GCD99208.1 hypothetical protein EHYA_06921 [Embleya hyalina]